MLGWSSFEYLPIYRLIKDSHNTVKSAIFKDFGFPSGNAIFVAAKEGGNNSQNSDSINNKMVSCHIFRYTGGI